MHRDEEGEQGKKLDAKKHHSLSKDSSTLLPIIPKLSHGCYKLTD